MLLVELFGDFLDNKGFTKEVSVSYDNLLKCLCNTDAVFKSSFPVIASINDSDDNDESYLYAGYAYYPTKSGKYYFVICSVNDPVYLTDLDIVLICDDEVLNHDMVKSALDYFIKEKKSSSIKLLKGTGSGKYLKRHLL